MHFRHYCFESFRFSIPPILAHALLTDASKRAQQVNCLTSAPRPCAPRAPGPLLKTCFVVP